MLPMVAKVCTLHEQWDQAKYGFRDNPQEMYRSWLIARWGGRLRVQPEDGHYRPTAPDLWQDPARNFNKFTTPVYGSPPTARRSPRHAVQ